MTKTLKDKKTQILLCIIIGLCFMWTGSGYLSWLYNMMKSTPTLNADLHSEVIGYIFQAAGIALFSLMVKRNAGASLSIPTYIGISVSDLLFACISSCAPNAVLVLTLGYLSNIFHGLIAGFYLSLLVHCLPPMKRGLCFGLGYAIGSLGSFLLSLIGKDNFLTSGYVHLIYVILFVLSLVAFLPISKTLSEQTYNQPEANNDSSTNKNKIAPLLFLACAAAFLLSLVKGLGFYFPMADINSGSISLEFTRLFYAVGLILAGLLNDLNRKYGIFACLIALVLPFVQLLLLNQTSSSLIVWIIGYLLTGFYTVYRVLLLGDLTKGRTHLFFIAGFGLLFGRLGDAAGAFLGMQLSKYIPVLVGISIALYILAAIVVMILFEKIYIPSIAKTEIATITLPEDEIHTTEPEAKEAPSSNETITDDATNLHTFINNYDFSKREIDILRFALTDMTNTQIASELFISVNTTKFHIRNILKKTGCANRNELKKLYQDLIS